MAPKYPSIPEPTIAPESLRDAVLTIKQAFEVLTGQRGNPNYRAVLLPELTASDNADDAAIAALTAKIDGYESAWTSYTPSLSPDGGTLGSANATGRYKKIGKTVFIQLNIHITTVGTATGFLNATLPFNTAGPCVIAGWENLAAGVMLQAHAYVVQPYFAVRTYNNLSPINANWNLLLGGVYEIS